MLALFATASTLIVARSQSVPTPAPMSIGAPGLLLTHLLRNTVKLPTTEQPGTVINAKSGYSRTNHSPTLEHLLRSHADAASPRRRGLRVTLLHTSTFPTAPAVLADPIDLVPFRGVTLMVLQGSIAGLLYLFGGASWAVPAAVVADNLANTAIYIMQRRARQRELQSARIVPEGKREVVCLTAGNGSSDAVVVVSEAGAVKLEDLAENRAATATPVRATNVVVPAALLAWVVQGVAFARLSVFDAWSVLGLAVVGVGYAMYSANSWRSPAALGFQIEKEETRVVHADKVMETLKEVEALEKGTGLALLPVFFPGSLRPDEEAFWETKKAELEWEKKSTVKV